MTNKTEIQKVLSEVSKSVWEINSAYEKGFTSDKVVFNLNVDLMEITIYGDDGFKTMELNPYVLSDVMDAYITLTEVLQNAKTSDASRRAAIKSMLDVARENLDFDCGIRLSQSTWAKMFKVAMDGFNEMKEE